MSAAAFQPERAPRDQARRRSYAALNRYVFLFLQLGDDLVGHFSRCCFAVIFRHILDQENVRVFLVQGQRIEPDDILFTDQPYSWHWRKQPSIMMQFSADFTHVAIVE